ncbi:uncharacterized protein LOC128642350 isoform X2 [Bombina bombina]|uniref:uncharacterized protein LOC128642350 isoform X2 n=1 Tax=Bombina bombina TaxID=8345 RepID=UPI00235A4955|nr:uncharacterized protein LOC128642350 isoform X2 [Bombina bombina]
MEQNHSTESSSGVGFVFICQQMLACLVIVGLLLLFPFAVIGLLIVYPVVTFCTATVFRTQLVVGIFSRSSAEEYSWFTNQLRSQTFQSFVKEIRPFYISNNKKPEFRNEVQQCNFAILYHTKNRGRINITNVTDSLYDHELNYMFGILGRPNVIVLIDDLDQCSTDEKLRILNEQPDIQTFAHELFLFSTGEKKVITGVSEKMMEIRDVMLGFCPDPSVQKFQPF